MAGTTSLRFLILLLGLSLLIVSLNAVPISRTRSMMHETHGHLVSGNTHSGDIEKSWEIGSTSGRMDMELNDYPGSGANNRHTPKPQQGRVCFDC